MKSIGTLLSAALIVSAAALWSMSASAFTLYFAGGEDTSFTVVGNGNEGTTTNAGLFRSGFARLAIGGGNGATAADPPANRITTPTFPAVSTLWIHAQFYVNSTVIASGQQALIIRSPDGVSRLLLRQTGTAGTLKASTRNAAGTITDIATASGTYPALSPTSLDVQIVYGCTSGDIFAVWIAGTQVINFTGSSLCTDAATTLNQADFASVNNVSPGSTNCAFGGTCWSEVIIADSDTRGMGLWTLAPQAAGNTQSWTPNTVGNVNPGAINDANFVSTGSNNALSEWTTPVSAPSGTWNVIAIVQEARVLASTLGPTTAEWLMRTKDGTDHVTGSFTPPVGAFGNFNNQIWTTNPHTGVGFVIGDIASGFNLGIESTP